MQWSDKQGPYICVPRATCFRIRLSMEYRILSRAYVLVYNESRFSAHRTSCCIRAQPDALLVTNILELVYPSRCISRASFRGLAVTVHKEFCLLVLQGIRPSAAATNQQATHHPTPSTAARTRHYSLSPTVPQASPMAMYTAAMSNFVMRIELPRLSRFLQNCLFHKVGWNV